MGRLFPVEFSALGVAELAWIALAFGALSCLAPGTEWRVRGAVRTGLLAFACGLIRLLAVEDESGWDRWGPVVFSPLFAAGLVLAGALPRVRARWLVAALAGLSAGAQPFGLHPWRDLDAWALLALLGTALAGLVAGEGPVRERLRRVRLPLAAALVALCAWRVPLGVGWGEAIALLVLLAVVYGVIAQGRAMQQYVKRRLLGAPIVLVIIMVLSFGLMQATPGGPFAAEKSVSPELKAAREKHYGLDKPLHVQFRKYFGRVVWEGDLGVSFKMDGQRINDVIRRHMGPSIKLGLAAIAIALAVGITAGLVAGIQRNSIFDYTSMAVAMLGLALPTFIVGPFLVLAFAVKLDWFRVSGFDELPRDLVLPALTLALPFMARVARLTRAGMLEVISQDYVRTARAKGLSEPVIVIRHTLKGALLPVVSFLGPALAQLLTGSLVVEKIFRVPGLGSEFVNSALNRDYPLVMGLVILFGTLLILFNLVVDVAYAFLDPRIRHA